MNWLIVSGLALCLNSTDVGEKGQPRTPESDWVTNDARGLKLVIGYLEKAGQNEIVVRASLDTLSGMGTMAKPAVSVVEKVVKRSSGDLRRAAARTLLHIDPENDLAFQTIMEPLTSKSPNARVLAARLIGEIVNPPPPKSFSCWGPPPPPRIPNLSFGKRAWPGLVKSLKDDSFLVRRNAIYSLGLIGSLDGKADAAIPFLAEALKDSASSVRAEACASLPKMGHAARKFVPNLVTALKDKEKRVQVAAARGLQLLDQDVFFEQAFPLVVAMLRNDPDVRRDAARILEDMSHESRRVIPVLCELLKDKDAEVRWTAARSIYGPGAKAAVLPLIEALRDKDTRVRGDAALSLGSIGVDAAPAVPMLEKALLDADERVCEYAAMGLGRIGPPAKTAVPSLLRVLKKVDGRTLSFLGKETALALGKIGAEGDVVVPALIQALQSKDTWTAEGAAEALGHFPSHAKLSAPELIAQLKKDSIMAADPTAATIKRFGPKAVDEAVSILIAGLKDDTESVRRACAHNLALLDTEAKSVPALVRVLREDPPIKYPAICTLGQMGPKAKSAVPDLVRALSDRNEAIRESAEEALSKIDPQALLRARKKNP